MNYYDVLFAKKLNGGGGGEAVLIDKNISANGTYNASTDSADGYKKVVVSVPNPSTGSLSITSNNTYDVTNYASAVVNVPNPSTGTISITTNGTVDVTNYASADVSVSGGNGYGGDGTWTRPMDLPKLDDMVISGGDVVYLTYDATEVEGFCDIKIERSSGDIVVDLGHIQNGSFVVEDTDTYTSNTTYKKYFGTPSGTYKVIRISGLITKIEFNRNSWTTYDGVYRYSGLQGIIEVYGKLPHLTSFASYGVGRIQAVHLGNAPLTNMDSMFYGDYHLESVDSRNWDVSNCTSMKYTFNDTRSLFKLDVSNWNTSKVTNCQATFLNSSAEVLDISNWDMSLVTNTTQFMQVTKQISITVPASLDNISANAFNSSDRGVLEYHFKATTPPTLANTNAFNGIRSQAKIYVPSASLTTYQGASNWSNYSTYMVGE